MAIPSSMTSGGLMPRRAGVRFGVFPTDPTFWTEVQCSSSTAFATSRTRFQRLAPSAANSVVATFEMPYSTKSYAARARHFKAGYSTGPWTTIAKGTPGYLVAQQPHLGYYAHHVAQMGLLTSAFSKTIRITWAEIIPLQTTQKWLFQAKGATPNSTGVFLQANCAFTVPNGVTIKKIVSQCLRVTAGSSATVTLMRGTATGGTIQISQLNTTVSASYHATNSSVISELVTSTKFYVIQFHARTTVKSTATVNSAFLYADVTYTMPHIGAAY